jgi:hypothetical protein
MNSNLIQFVPTVLIIGSFLLFWVILKRLRKSYKFFSKNWFIFLKLQEETIEANGFDGACVAYIKSRLFGKFILEKQYVLSPVFMYFYNTHMRSCVDRILFELELLDSFENGSHSFINAFSVIKRYLLEYESKNEYGRYELSPKMKNKIEITKGFEIKIDDITKDFNFFDYTIGSRIQSKIKDLCKKHIRKLVSEEEGYVLASDFLYEAIVFNSKRYAHHIRGLYNNYNFAENILKDSIDEMSNAFDRKLKALDLIEDNQKKLEAYKSLEYSFILRDFDYSYSRNDQNWFSNNGKSFENWNGIEKQYYSLYIKLCDAKDLVCVELFKSAANVGDKNKYLNMIRNKDIQLELNKTV